MVDDLTGKLWSSELSRLRQQLEASQGATAIRHLFAVQRSHSVLLHNQQELLEHLDLPTRDRTLTIELYQNTRDPAIRDSYLLAFARYLHNYVAAVKSLVDHTRRIAEKQTDESFRYEYDLRKDAVAGQPVTGFVQSLRNYVLHYGYPPFVGRVQPGQTPALSMVLRCSQLRKWKGWTPEGRRFLTANAPEFSIQQPIHEYVDIIEDLYQWFYEEYERMHQPSLAAFEHLRLEYNALLTGGPEAMGHRNLAPGAQSKTW